MAKLRKQPTSRTFELQNGITLLVSYGKPAPPLGAIESFLSDVLAFFKQRRDEMHEEVFKEVPLQPGWASFEGRFYGNCYLEHEGDEAGNYLATDAWVKTIAAALATANTVTQMAGSLDAYRAQADGWLKDVVAALDKPHGDLDAFDIALWKREVNIELDHICDVTRDALR